MSVHPDMSAKLGVLSLDCRTRGGFKYCFGSYKKSAKPSAYYTVSSTLEISRYSKRGIDQEKMPIARHIFIDYPIATYTVEPLNKGHLRTDRGHCPLFGGCPLLGGFSEKVE